MAEPVLPYESETPTPTGRHVFGVIVRTLGLLVALYAIYSLIYAGAEEAMALVSTYSARTYFVLGLIYLTIGIVLIRGEWLVRFAYGRQ